MKLLIYKATSLELKKYILNVMKKIDYTLNIGTSSNLLLHDNYYIIFNKNYKIGFFELNNISDKHQRANLNICLDHSSFFFNLYAIFNIIPYIFKNTKLNKIIIKVKETNTKMIKILDKYNLDKEGYYDMAFKQNENYYGIYFYTILRTEYLELRNDINKKVKKVSI